MPGSPFLQPDLWQQVIVQGVTWNGKVSIKGHKRSYKWDVKNGAGLEGATETYRGRKPEPFTIAFHIWTDDQYTLWTTFSLAFQYAGTKGLVVPVSIYHPSLSLIGITQVICEDLGGVEPVSDDGMYVATVRLREFFPAPPLNATTTPVAGTGTPAALPGRPPNPAIVALQAQIELLRAQRATLGATLP